MKSLLLAVFLILAACQKEKITIGTNVSEAFYLDNNGASMRILVEGNTTSKTFLLFVHGGPGSDSNCFNTDYVSQNIEDKYAVVYWDQRNSGASQGNSNGKKLNLLQMSEDLKKVILVLKSRYGQNTKVFILGHSFGGLLTASFMTTENYQSMVKGWIFMDGDHNYPLNDSLTRQKLLTYGQQQIDLNKNTDKWKPILKYCHDHTGGLTHDESVQLNSYAHAAETYFDEVKKYGYKEIIEYYTKNDFPITSALINGYRTSNADFNTDLYKTEFTTSLHKVVTPVLILFGEYDFTCTKEMGVDLFNHINTTDKEISISSKSGHYMYYQDESFFCKKVNEFIAKH